MCGHTNFPIAASESAANRVALETNSWRPMDFGRWRGSHTRPRLDHRFAGSDHASREAEQTIGDASRSDLAQLIFVPTPPTEWATTGPSPTRNSRPTTTRLNPTSASSVPRKISPTLQTAYSCRHPTRGAPKPL